MSQKKHKWYLKLKIFGCLISLLGVTTVKLPYLLQNAAAASIKASLKHLDSTLNLKVSACQLLSEALLSKLSINMVFFADFKFKITPFLWYQQQKNI